MAMYCRVYCTYLSTIPHGKKIGVNKRKGRNISLYCAWYAPTQQELMVHEHMTAKDAASGMTA